jgi:hypothetical protein
MAMIRTTSVVFALTALSSLVFAAPTLEEPRPSKSLQVELQAAINQSLQARLVALPDPFANWHKPLPNGPHETTCADLPIMEHTCLGVYLQESDLSLSVYLSIKGTSVLGHKVFAANISMAKVSANHFCLKDTDLLELIELIPGLIAFKPIIDKIIKEIGKIPAHVFSVCAELDNNHVDTAKKTYTVDPKLVNNIMCWDDHCLCSDKCTIDFGNQTIHY